MAEETTKEKSIEVSVLEQIKTGKAKMRPRWYFILASALASAWLIASVFASLYLVSMVFFILNRNESWFLPVFGWRGVSIFLVSLPWLLILTGIMAVVSLEAIIHNYSFAYRKPLLYSLVGLVVFVAAASIAVSRTPFHNNLDARSGDLPVVGRLYRVYRLPKNGGAHIGKILEITDDGFRMKNLQDKDDTLYITVTSQTSFPAGVDFQRGDSVLILGDRSGNAVKASGILRVNAEDGRRPCQHYGWYSFSTCFKR